MGFATDNGKGMTVTAPSGVDPGGRQGVVVGDLGPGNYEYLQLQSDGSNFRVVSAHAQHAGDQRPGQPRLAGQLALSVELPAMPRTLGDNGNVLSSFNTSGGLTVTLPPTTGIAVGLVDGVRHRQRQGADRAGQRHRRRPHPLSAGRCRGADCADAGRQPLRVS